MRWWRILRLLWFNLYSFLFRQTCVFGKAFCGEEKYFYVRSMQPTGTKITPKFGRCNLRRLELSLRLVAAIFISQKYAYDRSKKAAAGKNTCYLSWSSQQGRIIDVVRFDWICGTWSFINLISLIGIQPYQILFPKVISTVPYLNSF